MRILPSLIIIVIASVSRSQEVIPIIDFNDYFRSFEDGNFKQIEFQQIKEFKAGDDVVGYVDIRGNLQVYDGNEVENLANITTEYTVSDNLLTWQIGETLNLWDDGSQKTLSFYTGLYAVKDSIVVFQDNRFKTLNVYYQGEVYPLTTSIEKPRYADFIGENIVVFRDNGNVYKVFWRGGIYELDAWHDKILFDGGTDIVAFNDPMTGTFAIFEDGVFKDLVDYHVNKFKAGRGILLYENQNGELMLYHAGKVKKLSNFVADFWDVKDDIILWEENGIYYGFQNDEKIELARYRPEEVQLKNNTIAFRNLMGGVDALIDGKLINITNQRDAIFTIYGNTVLVELFNKSFIVQTADKAYRL